MVQKAAPIVKDDNLTKKKSTPNKSYRAEDLMQAIPADLHVSSTIRQAIVAFCKHNASSLLVTGENPLDQSVWLSGRVCIKDVLRLLFPALIQKDIISLNQVLYKSIEQILVRQHQSLNPQSDMKDILSAVLDDYSRVAGIEQEGKLVGQISYKDLLELFILNNNNQCPLTGLIESVILFSAKVSEAMARHVICLGPKDEIAKAVGVFIATSILSIPILDEKGNLKRIFSQLDLMEYVLELIESKELTVFEKKGLILDRNIGSLGEKDFTTISDNNSLVYASKEMIEKDVLCLAVTDAQKRFYGILSCTDILNWFLNHLKAQAK